MALVAAAALADGADTLITCGGVQSNHARVTAITAAKLGLRCILVVNASNGQRPADPGNALLNQLAGAEVRYVASRGERDAGMAAAAAEVQRAGGRPYVIPLGASTPLGAAAFVSAVDELLAQVDRPTSSCTRPPRAARRPAWLPDAASPASGPASSASAPTIPRRPCRPRSEPCCRGWNPCSTSAPTDSPAPQSRWTTRSSAGATACRPTRLAKRCCFAREAKGCFSTRPTPPRRWPA